VTKLPGITLNHCSVQQLLHLLLFKVVLLLNSGPVVVVRVYFPVSPRTTCRFFTCSIWLISSLF